MKYVRAPKNFRFVCPPEMRLHCDSVLRGEYEVPLPQQPFRILDIGANCGAFSVWAAHRFPGSHITAYEPFLQNFTYLAGNTRELSGCTVDLKQVAVGDPARTRLYLGKHNTGECSLRQMGEQREEFVEVRTVPPGSLPEADILKLDTEGSEIQILGPLLEMGRHFHAVVFEYHDEGERRLLDSLLDEYTLVGAYAQRPDRGVCRYLNNRTLETLRNHSKAGK